MSTLLCVSLFVLVSLVSQSSCSSVYIGTGRGAIRAIKTGNSYTLREVPLWDYEEGTTWTLEQDPRFPNGVFIHSVTYPGLVWDTQAYQFTPGTNVTLWPKKNTLVDTKNQRWVLNSANQYGIIYNTNIVASVNQGRVVLANKGTSQYQKFYPLSTEDMWGVTFENYMFVDIQVLVQSPIGNYTYEVTSSHNPSGAQFFPGSILTFDLNPPYVYKLTGPSAWLVFPIPPPLPVGTPTTWTGNWVKGGDWIPIEFSLTFTDDSYFFGSGSTEEYNDFVVSGTKDRGLHMSVSYADDTKNFSFEGVLTNDDGIQMSGTTQSFDSECDCTSWGQLYITMQ